MAQNNGEGPGRPRIGAPGSGGAPGAGGGGRVFQWKGKSTAPGAASAPVAAAAEASVEAEVEVESGAGARFDESLDRMEAMFEEMGEVHTLLVKLSDRDTHNEKAFNTLHAELSDYKKDFIYEHLKPVVRPLLFLYDSIEGFESEVSAFEGEAGTSPSIAPGSGAMPTRAVRQNAVYFREQLVEALRICEVTPMDTPTGKPDGKFHKAIQAVPVEAEQDGLIQRVVRSGWFLNGHLLRPAEVVVGKFRG